MQKPWPSLELFPFEHFRVQVRDREIKVNIFDMAGHPFFYEVRKLFWENQYPVLSVDSGKDPELSETNKVQIMYTIRWI